MSLVGNVAGVVGGIALLAGAGPTAILFSGIGIAANVYGIAYSDVGQKLFRSLIEPVFQKYFATNLSAAYPEYWLAPDLVLESLDRIKSAYGGESLSLDGTRIRMNLYLMVIVLIFTIALAVVEVVRQVGRRYLRYSLCPSLQDGV